MRNHNPKVTQSRREFIAKAGAIGTAAVFGGVASPVLAKSKPALRVGVLNSFSGVFAALGSDNLNGMNLYFDAIGRTIAGRKIEIFKEDDEIKRSEEHTSELQSLMRISYAVFCLKKKNIQITKTSKSRRCYQS